ncbi:MAG: PTS sugar transporter subunit IIA [Mycoplasmatales bacterium]
MIDYEKLMSRIDPRQRTRYIEAFVLYNEFEFERLEIVFGRSRKTLYKDIANARITLENEFQKKNQSLTYLEVQCYVNQVYKYLIVSARNVTEEEREQIVQAVLRTLRSDFKVSIMGTTQCQGDDQFIQINKNFGSCIQPNNQKVVKLISELTSNLKQLLDIELTKSTKEMLRRYLGSNIGSYTYNILETDESIKPLVVKYEQQFAIFDLLLNKIFTEFNLFTNELENTYITLIILSEEPKLKKKVMLVWDDSEFTTLAVKLQLTDLFENFEFVQPLENQSADIIITNRLSFTNEKHGTKVIYVQNFLTENNLEKLSKILKLNSSIEYDALRMYNSIEDMLNSSISFSKFKRRFINVFLNATIVRRPMLKELLNIEVITKEKKVENWESAIKLCASPLVKQAKIKEPYVQAMIDVIKEYGSYVVLVDGFAMPHANRIDLVNETSISLLILEEEVIFPGEKPVNVIMCIASVNSEEHLNALSELFNLLKDSDFVKRLLKMENENEILKYLGGTNE